MGRALWRAAITGLPVVLSVAIGPAAYAQGPLSAIASGPAAGRVTAGAPAQDPKGAKPKPIFRIDDPRVVESSGLAASSLHPDVYYTMNDSGGDAEVYAVDGGSGEVRATIELGQVDPYDWEAIAPGPENRIWIGDIGDNERARDDITLYRFIEPDTLADASLLWSSFDFQFTNGPRDAEALLIHPETGQVYVVSKTAGGGAVYAGPEVPSAEYVNELNKVADAPSLVTDGAFLPDGSAIVLRNYEKAFVMSWPDAEITQTIELPKVKQGESLAVSPDGKRILIGSEGEGSPVYSISLASGKPTNSSTPKPQESAAAADEDESDSGSARGAEEPMFGGIAGWVLLLIVGVALLAGLLSFPRGRARPRPAAAGGRLPPDSRYRGRPGEGRSETSGPTPRPARDAGTYGPGPYRRRRTPRPPGDSGYPPEPHYPRSSYTGREPSDDRYSSDRPYWRER